MSLNKSAKLIPEPSKEKAEKEKKTSSSSKKYYQMYLLCNSKSTTQICNKKTTIWNILANIPLQQA